MVEISENALMMSVQAISEAVKCLSAERHTASAAEQAHYDDIIEAYEIAAMELRSVYANACEQGVDLPAYDTLTL